MSDTIYDRNKATRENWEALVKKQSKGQGPDTLAWHTAEDITVKPLYTAADIEALEYTDTMPGMSPIRS